MIGLHMSKDWNHYSRQQIKDEKKLAILLIVLGMKAYSLL